MTNKHGLSIGITRVDDKLFMEMKATGKLTHEDYKTITPMLDSAVKGIDHPNINMLLDATELKGWELRAAWDDFKLGLKHGKEFNKIAIVGHEKWMEYAAKMGSWFIAGQSKQFDDLKEATDWLKG
jgi:hypothetical protein